MIGISTTVYDPNGYRYFHRGELSMGSVIGNRAGTRRVSRTPTLDGRCSVSDGGYSSSDKTVKIECPTPPLEIIEFMAYILQNYNTVLVFTQEGAFTGSPQDLGVSDKSAQLTILITGEA